MKECHIIGRIVACLRDHAEYTVSTPTQRAVLRVTQMSALPNCAYLDVISLLERP